MSLAASCPRCTSPVSGGAQGYVCDQHGSTDPLWRPRQVGHDSFTEVVERIEDHPIYLPWPMSPGWTVSDFGCVGVDRVRATVTTTVGASDMDGDVEVTIVSEEPGTGLGARCAAAAYDDPGPQTSNGPPTVHVRAAGRALPMWLVDGLTGDTDDAGDVGEDPLVRAVFVGEAEGRWLWLVVRPASAALLLQDEWLLADVTGFGPEALAMPFGGPRPTW